MKYTVPIVWLLILVHTQLTGQDSLQAPIPNFEIDEIVVFREYPFVNEKERIEYKKLEADIRKIYPLLTLITTEFDRINEEMNLYDTKRRKDFLKWYENYARENYMPLLGSLSIPQGQLLLLLIDRETGDTPYQLIKTYRNGFRAFLWQGVAFFFRSNLNAEYKPENHPMIEHIIKRVESEFTLSETIEKKHTLTKSPSL
ncbi:MAG TPA: DUF4294 domain-containing protein [Prolixibacteraceae bacterium]|nr:DUF4294 domain-containing protein [Prolixibacteraceae bacterium]